MRSKLQLASGIAVAATMLTALLGAGGTGALAQEWAPGEVEPTQAAQPAGSKTQFVSIPVVQSTETENAASVTAGDEDESEGFAPESLHELVAAHSIPDALSPEMNCLAGAIYFESRGESLSGQLAVGRVIINRAKSPRFPDSYCGVVFQPSQFSFVRGRSMPKIRTNSDAWRKAVAVAQIAHRDSWDSPVEGALFFHASRVSPRWGKTRLAQVDNHIFYR